MSQAVVAACARRDEARNERDLLRAEVERLVSENVRLRAERDAANTEANRLTGYDRFANQVDPRPEKPPLEDAECCASGRCEVCSPGYVWGRDG